LGYPSDFSLQSSEFLQGICVEKIGCPAFSFSARFFRKTIDYVNRCVNICTNRTSKFSNLSFLLFSLLCCL